jgi:hypothetical protein
MSEMVELSVRSSRKYPLDVIVPPRLILMSSPSVRVQPLKLIAELELLKSSIHSSLAEANVPAQANSFIRIVRAGYGGLIGVGSGVFVGVADCVGVGEGEVVKVGLEVEVIVMVKVSVGVGVSVISNVGVNVGSGSVVVLGEGERVGGSSALAWKPFDPSGIDWVSLPYAKAESLMESSEMNTRNRKPASKRMRTGIFLPSPWLMFNPPNEPERCRGADFSLSCAQVAPFWSQRTAERFFKPSDKDAGPSVLRPYEPSCE